MPRRLSTYILLVGFVLILLIFFTSPGSPPDLPPESLLAEEKSSFSGKLPSFSRPSFHFSFRKSSHKPPEQLNSTSGASSWYSDWKWHNPFSSSITLDEHRSVLPPLPPRPPVYTYYDPGARQDEASIKVEKKLLQTWRRAWWAHGFRPVVLGKGEAQNNPLYERLQGLSMSEGLEFEMHRWLAWGHMGTGLLASFHCVPMGAGDDPLLSYLRRGQYPMLTRFDGLKAGLFAGGKDQIRDAIQEGLNSENLKTAKNILEVLKPTKFRTERAGPIAHYNSATLTSKYPALAEKIVTTPDEGRLALDALINSHLHSTWQNIFAKGVAVLKPLPAHSSALIAPSFHLAHLLAQCPESILPSSCPPNRPKCTPCVSARMKITTPTSFQNVSDLYPIGIVPHPYTMITLNNQSDAITIRHIRRYTTRDPWLTAITRTILGDGRGGASRVVGFKDVVASEFSRGRGLWLTTETLPASLSAVKEAPLPEEWLSHLDWHFGFTVPRTPITDGESIPPVPGPERWAKSKPGLPEEKKKSYQPDPPTDVQMAIEVELLNKARKRVNTKGDDLGHTRMRDVAEAWNVADTEAWRFARAYRARGIVERLKWEEEERDFAGVREKGKWWRL